MANVTVTDQHEEVGGGDASYHAIDERNYPSLMSYKQLTQ